MQKIIINPLDGIEIENMGSIKLGQEKAEVFEILKNFEPDGENNIYYDDLELRIDLNKDGKVEFIELYGPFCEKISPLIYGINPFKVTAKDLIKLLSSKNNGKIDDTEAPYGYSYLGSSVGVWRDLTEKEAKEDIEEAKKDGEYEDWMEEDLEKAKYFWTIGIGEKDYYKL